MTFSVIMSHNPLPGETVNMSLFLTSTAAYDPSYWRSCETFCLDFRLKASEIIKVPRH